jgi:hypothetical protein
MMNRSASPHFANMPRRRQELAADPVQQVADKTGAPIGVVRTFTKISAPENAHLFTAEAAHKAFAHLKQHA